jgi:hypothetical protein
MACAFVSSRFLSAASWLPRSALRGLGLRAQALRGWPGDVVRVWRLRLRRLHDPYRPELHYMRGPGPKWREKHSQVYASAGREIGEFARAAI